MQKKSFCFKKACSVGWKKFVENIGLLVKLSALLLVIGFVLGIVIKIWVSDNYIINFIIFMPFFLLSMCFLMQSIKLSLALHEGESFEIKDFFSLPDNIFIFTAGLMLFSIIVSVGYIFLIIPGIILYLMFSMFPFLMIEKKLSPVEALKESARLTKGSRLKILGCFLLITFLSFLSLIPVVNFLVMFFVLLIVSDIYFQLKDSSGDV